MLQNRNFRRAYLSRMGHIGQLDVPISREWERGHAYFSRKEAPGKTDVLRSRARRLLPDLSFLWRTHVLQRRSRNNALLQDACQHIASTHLRTCSRNTTIFVMQLAYANVLFAYVFEKYDVYFCTFGET